MLTESTLHFMNLTWGLRSKKYNLAGKVTHWRSLVDPKGSKAKLSGSPVTRNTSESGTSQSTNTPKSSKTTRTSATTASLVNEPPPSITNASETSDRDALDRNSEDEDDSQERLAALAAEQKGKATMRVRSSKGPQPSCWVRSFRMV
jgi:hypothetical protein